MSPDIDENQTPPLVLLTLPDPPPRVPPAWADLIAALTLLARAAADHEADAISPLQCSHDLLTVNASPDAFTADELAQLDTWGFRPDHHEQGFASYRFGS